MVYETFLTTMVYETRYQLGYLFQDDNWKIYKHVETKQHTPEQPQVKKIKWKIKKIF